VQDLVDFMVRSVVNNPDAISLNVTEGDASVLFELDVHDDDRARLLDGDNQLIAAMRQILAASGGNRRGVLELVGESDAAEE
jgi:hypothetical protein